MKVEQAGSVNDAVFGSSGPEVSSARQSATQSSFGPSVSLTAFKSPTLRDVRRGAQRRARGRGYVPPRIPQESLLPKSGKFTLKDTWREASAELGMNGSGGRLAVAPNKLSFRHVLDLQQESAR